MFTKKRQKEWDNLWWDHSMYGWLSPSCCGSSWSLLELRIGSSCWSLAEFAPTAESCIPELRYFLCYGWDFACFCEFLFIIEICVCIGNGHILIELGWEDYNQARYFCKWECSQSISWDTRRVYESLWRWVWIRRWSLIWVRYDVPIAYRTRDRYMMISVSQLRSSEQVSRYLW